MANPRVGKLIKEKIQEHPIQIETITINPKSCLMVVGGWMRIATDYERSQVDSEIRRFKASLRHPLKEHLRKHFNVDMDRLMIELDVSDTGNTPLKGYNYFAIEFSLFFDEVIDIKQYELHSALLILAEKTLEVVYGIDGFDIVANKKAKQLLA